MPKSSIFRVLLLLTMISNFVPVQNFIAVEKIPADSFQLDEKLQAETDSLLPLFEQMPSVPVYLKDEPIIKSGTNTERGVAYTNCARNESPTIFVKKTFYQTANRKQLINILKHELTHSWLCRQNLMAAGHDARFREKFKKVGGFGN